MKTLIINLPECHEKKAYIESQCKRFNLDYEVMNAVRGDALSEEKINELVHDYPACSLTKGEIGCALSHLAVYRKMVEEEIAIALVLEDDAMLQDDLLAVLNMLEDQNNTQKSQVILLSEAYYYIQSPNQPLHEKYTLNRALSAYYTYGYVINLAAAKALYAFLTPLRFEADRWTYFQQCDLIRLDCVVPPVVSTIDESKATSSIHSERERLATERKAYYKKLKKKIPLSKIIKRALWRAYAHIFCTVFDRRRED